MVNFKFKSPLKLKGCANKKNLNLSRNCLPSLESSSLAYLARSSFGKHRSSGIQLKVSGQTRKEGLYCPCKHNKMFNESLNESKLR